MSEQKQPVGETAATDSRANGIAYCGLYCEECFGHTGQIADLARDLRAELRKARFDRIAGALANESFFKVFADYPQAYELLGALVKLRCKNMCKGGGGPPYCKIRRCSQGKALAGCWECAGFETCDKLKTLAPAHNDAHIRNLKKLRRSGVAGFISGPKHW